MHRLHQQCDPAGRIPSGNAELLQGATNAVLLQMPIVESKFQGVVDLIEMRAVYFDGPHGEELRYEEIPAALSEQAQRLREEMIDQASMYSDELTETILEEREITTEMIFAALRLGTLKRQITPVVLGSAYKNKGVQKLLDTVTSLLPCPAEVENSALNLDENEAPVILNNSPDQPIVALAFKLEDGPFGQLTYIRVYQGTIAKGTTIVNVRSGKKIKVGRLARMHADQMEDIDTIPAGYIGALFGVECASGDTFVSPGLNLAMTSMYVPAPVISLAIVPKDNKAQINMSKALSRFTKEDPTFKCHVDRETNETIIAGMGELHLDVYVERMRREYAAEVTTGNPRVAYRETITQRADFNYIHKKQTGGAGQYGRIAGYIEPTSEGDFIFENDIVGGAIPTQYIPACEKGFRQSLEKGPKLEFPITGIKVVINDGAYHAVDSSDMAFQAAARGAFRDAYLRARPVVHEPIMKVVIESPTEFQGPVMALLNQRRGMIVGAQDEGVMCIVEAQVPLAEMFGFSTVLRSATQGKAQFTMEFSLYRQVPNSIAEKIAEEIAARKKNAA